MSLYTLDTDICSYSIKDNPTSVREKIWAHRKDTLCITSITYSELLYGAQKKGAKKLIAKINQFIDRFEILPYDRDAADEFIRIRLALEKKGAPIGNFDIQIAACAKSRGAVLVTHNNKHFSQIDGLVCENWT